MQAPEEQCFNQKKGSKPAGETRAWLSNPQRSRIQPQLQRGRCAEGGQAQGQLAWAALSQLFQGKERVSQGTGCAHSWALVAKFSSWPCEAARGGLPLSSPRPVAPLQHPVARGLAGHGARVSGASTVAGPSVHSSCPVMRTACAPRAHHLQDTALREHLGQGQGWTQHLVGAATSPRHHLLRQHKGEDPPIRMYLSPVPTRYYRHLTTMQGKERANIPGSAPHLHAPLSYVLHGGSQDVGSREQTRSRSDGKSLNEGDLAESLWRGSVNLLAVMLPASCGALDPGGESPCRWGGRKLSAERC